jgi:adenosylcobinamide kinase/adenosylcobinamide-phosphate guanylyltransferase
VTVGYRLNGICKTRDGIEWLYIEGRDQLAYAEKKMKRHSRIILVTGAARSGKSQYAERRCGEMGGSRLYIATAESKDEEMSERIAEHQRRRGREWTTIEEPLELTETLIAQRGKMDCVLVDCLTLWISNLLIGRDGRHALEKVEQLIATLPGLDFGIVLVTNEVGWGIVPDNPLAREFRDLTGRTNQRIAQAADEVILMVAGVAMTVKKAPICS